MGGSATATTGGVATGGGTGAGLMGGAGLATALGRVCTLIEGTFAGIPGLAGMAGVGNALGPTFDPFFTRSLIASAWSGSKPLSWFVIPANPSSLQ